MLLGVGVLIGPWNDAWEDIQRKVNVFAKVTKVVFGLWKRTKSWVLSYWVMTVIAGSSIISLTNRTRNH